MPPHLPNLHQLIKTQRYLLTLHASTRLAERLILSHEIEQAIINGEVIEDYPNDKYGPSCLILGYTAQGRALHIQVSYPPNVKIITLYEPSLREWLSDLKTRRPHE